MPAALHKADRQWQPVGTVPLRGKASPQHHWQLCWRYEILAADLCSAAASIQLHPLEGFLHSAQLLHRASAKSKMLSCNIHKEAHLICASLACRFSAVIVDNTIKSLNTVRLSKVITAQLAVCDTPNSMAMMNNVSFCRRLMAQALPAVCQTRL